MSSSESEGEDERLESFFGSLDTGDLAVFGKRSAKKKRVEEARPRRASTPGWDKPEGRARLPVKLADGKVHQQAPRAPKQIEEEAVESEAESGGGGGGESGADDGVSDEEASVDGDNHEIEQQPNGSAGGGGGGKGSSGAATGLSPAQLLAMRQARCRQVKARIAELCEAILESPSEALMAKKAAAAEEAASGAPNPARRPKKAPPTRMQELLALVKDHDAVVQQLAAVSALAVFRDILPGYRIRVPTEKERAQRVSKQVQQARTYDAAMLTAYQSYLKLLEGLTKGSAEVSPENGDKTAAPADATTAVSRRAAARCAVRCLCQLLESHPHFNFRSNLIAAIVPRLSSNDQEVRATCHACFARIFASDARGEVSLEAVKAVSRFLKQRRFRAHEDVVRVLQTLPLRVHEDDAAEIRAKARGAAGAASKKRKQMSGGAHRNAAAAAAAFDGLPPPELQLDSDKDLKAKCQADALHELTLVYFRLLKDDSARAASPRLLPAVLEGLGRVAHLINLDTVVDLMAALRELLSVDSLGIVGGLSCVLVALRTLQGPGRELRVDEKAFLQHLYVLLGRLNDEDAAVSHGRSSSHASVALVPLACSCVEAGFVKRKEYSAARAAAVTKRLCAAALNAQAPSDAERLLRQAQQMALRYPPVRRLLDGGHDRITAGSYDPTLNDPELCSALAATCWELSLLVHSPDKDVRDAVKDLTLLGTRTAAEAVAALRPAAAAALSGIGEIGAKATFLGKLAAPDVKRAVSGGARGKKRHAAASAEGGAGNDPFWAQLEAEAQEAAAVAAATAAATAAAQKGEEEVGKGKAKVSVKRVKRK